jgi:hypothetical protein
MSTHTMKVTISYWGHVDLKLVCHETERWSLCHLICKEQCDGWNIDDHVMPGRENGVEEGHQLEWRPICNAVEWMEDEGPEEHFVGEDPTPLSDGMPVEVKFDGDTYVWKVVAS